MGLESGSFISALVSTNPVGAVDPKSQGDDHIRFIKAKLLETFPNVTGAVTPTHTELNYVDGVTSAIQTQLDAKQASDADLTAIAGLTTTASTIPMFTGAGTATLLSVGTASGNVPRVGTSSATETLAGLIEIATTAESAAGTDTIRAITPAGLFGGLNATGTAPIYACRAWVNFDGTGVVTIRSAGNVGSITDNGTGDYTINFTTAMPDANYAVLASSSQNSASQYSVTNTITQLAGSVRVQNSNLSASLVDNANMFVAIFR